MTGTAAHGTKKSWGSLTGSWSLSHPCPSQGTAVPRWSVPSAPHTCPTLWHNAQSTSIINKNSISQNHPVTCELTDSLSLQLCGWTSPSQLPNACSALQSSTAFKQEPHHPPVNHLTHHLTPTRWTDDNSDLLNIKHPFYRNRIVHPSCPHILTAHLCP